MRFYDYKLGEMNFSFQISDKAFIPTATSDFLIKACIKEMPDRGTVLDLGCGVGIVGISISKLTNSDKIFFSDVSEEAIKICKNNSEKYNLNYVAKVGSLFEPWGENKFDYIVDDISGVSETLANLSSWFSNVPCNSGEDGTYLTLKVLKNSENFLNKNGRLFFPIISLSNAEKIIECAKKYFKNVKVLSSNSWFMPEELSKYYETLIELRNQKKISFEEKFGRIICSTDIYMAYN